MDTTIIKNINSGIEKKCDMAFFSKSGEIKIDIGYF